MSSNVGLSTPRGSGTSGYVQRNLSHLRTRDTPYSSPDPSKLQAHRQRQPDAAILEHDRRRAIELQIFELRDTLEDEGKDDDEIDSACDALRSKLEKEESASAPKKGLKSHQVHELARAKIEESERLRRALGIREDYEEGSHWKRQEESRREDMVRGIREEQKKGAEPVRKARRSPSESRSRSRSRSRSYSRTDSEGSDR